MLSVAQQWLHCSSDWKELKPGLSLTPRIKLHSPLLNGSGGSKEQYLGGALYVAKAPDVGCPWVHPTAGVTQPPLPVSVL